MASDEQATGAEIVGHKTFWNDDGTHRHEPLRRDEAEAILAAADAAKAKREADMPTEQAAIDAMFQAFQRLKELGWSEASYCPKDGTAFKAIEAGSTGIHPCFYQGEWPTGYFMLGEGEWIGPSHPILYKLHPEDEAKRIAKMAAARARYRAERETSP